MSWNVLTEPLNVYLIFSNCRLLKMSLIHCVWEARVGDFHFISIRCLANSVTKAIKSACVLDIGTSEMPNRAVIGLGSIGIPVSSVRVAKISVQNVFNDAHDQNMCACVTGV